MANNEFDNAINNSSLSDKSITTYTHSYNRLMNYLKSPILNYTEKQIINIIDKIDAPSMSKNSMLSVVSLVRKDMGLSTEKLTEYRKKLNENHYENKQKSNEILKDNLPTLNTLQEFTNQLYKDKKYTDFIINYIMLNFNTRNMDLDLMLIADKKLADDSINYIYATNKYLLYVRNNYKTRDRYGVKKVKIYNAKMMRAFQILLQDKTEHTLIETSNLNKFIQDRTFNGIGEGRYVKVVLNDYYKNGNIDGFKKVSNNRGTSLDILYNDYNIEV